MSNHTSESSLPVLSHADGFAASASDALLLVGRVALGWLFLSSAWGKFMNMGGYVGYLTNLKVPNPGFFSWIGAPVEFLIGLTLILGFATRYAALVMAQYNNFVKNLAIFGGTLVLFVAGAGRFSADRALSNKD